MNHAYEFTQQRKMAYFRECHQLTVIVSVDCKLIRVDGRFIFYRLLMDYREVILIALQQK